MNRKEEALRAHLDKNEKSWALLIGGLVVAAGLNAAAFYEEPASCSKPNMKITIGLSGYYSAEWFD